METVFLVLHYKTIDSTVMCINSILERFLDAVIVVVDNGSGDGSGERIKEEFSQSDRLHVILCNNNKGFSRGNNIGYAFIKKTYNADFLIVCNNDIVFYQDDFLKRIESIYYNHKFYVLAPDIMIPNENRHDNPHYIEKWDTEYVKNRIARLEKKARLPVGRSTIGMLLENTAIHRLYFKYIYPYTKRGRKKELLSQSAAENIGVSGACLVFSKDFLECNEQLFYPETFFYCEEEILLHKCITNGWTLRYDPQISVIHEEGKSTKSSFKGAINRRKFKYKHGIESSKIYLDYLLSSGGK